MQSFNDFFVVVVVVSEWVSEWVSECECECECEWVSEWASEQASEPVSEDGDCELLINNAWKHRKNRVKRKCVNKRVDIPGHQVYFADKIEQSVQSEHWDQSPSSSKLL